MLLMGCVHLRHYSNRVWLIADGQLYTSCINKGTLHKFTEDPESYVNIHADTTEATNLPFLSAYLGELSTLTLLEGLCVGDTMVRASCEDWSTMG